MAKDDQVQPFFISKSALEGLFSMEKRMKTTQGVVRKKIKDTGSKFFLRGSDRELTN